MGASASLFRKGEYPTEKKDLDIIIDIFTKMKFYSSGKDKEKLSQELDVYMSITQAIYKVIYQNCNIKDAIYEIMNNEFKAENEWTSF